MNEKNVPSYEDMRMESRREIRRKRELRRRKKRQRRIMFLLCIIIFICLIGFFGKNKNNDQEIVNNDIGSDTKILAESVPTVSPFVTSQEKDEEIIDENEFKKLYYYEDDKLERYIFYKNKHPKMSVSDVVWRVNSNIDIDWYGESSIVDGYDYSILVNKYNKVPDGYKPPDLVTVDNQMMRKATADAYLKMRKELEAQGLKICAVSGYRSVEYQKNLYNRYLSEDSKEAVDRYSARPGHSEHHTGLALDLFGSTSGLRNFIKTPEYEWVRDNCHTYGFIIRYQRDIEDITGYEDEPWHIRYVGTDISIDMKNKGIKSYEEYYVKYIKHKG